MGNMEQRVSRQEEEQLNFASYFNLIPVHLPVMVLAGNTINNKLI